MTRNQQKENLKEAVLKALADYRDAFLKDDYLVMASTQIIPYAKKGLLQTLDGDVCLWHEIEPRAAYKILRLAKRGMLTLNERSIYVL